MKSATGLRTAECAVMMNGNNQYVIQNVLLAARHD